MTDWTVIALFVNAAVGGLIAWQAWETRKTALTGREGVDASREGVEVARKSVEVSQALAIDSTKARLDARAPKLMVIAAPTENEVVHGASNFGEDQPWPPGQSLRRSQDDDKVLVMGAQIDVRNEDDRSVRLWVDGETKFLQPGEADVQREASGRAVVWLQPGRTTKFRVVARDSLKQWAEVWKARATGDVTPAIRHASVICSDSYDEGVIDRWEIEIAFYPVESIPDDLAGWKVRSGPVDPLAVNASVRPLERQYYRSKRDNRRLDG